MIPGIYQSEEEINTVRCQFSAWMERIKRYDDEKLYGILRRHTHAGLAYQGLNDKLLQKRFGELLQRVVTPPAVKLSPKPRRIAIVSSNIGATSAAAWIISWMRLLPDVEWYVYQVGRRVQDPITQIFKSLGKFQTLPDRFKTASYQIAQDRPAAIIYPDIGFHPVISLLASLRLAPVQCACWGHPVTTGIPTIDYFLSAEAYEPKGAQDHYTEQLIKLPGVGMPLPRIPAIPPDKEHFDIQGKTVFLMVQNPSKYLPQYDWIYQELARTAKNPIFVFMDYPSHFTRKLIGRMNLPARIYPWLPREEFWRLIASGDVFLDPPGWSGANTTHEAISQGTPVVTIAGDLMRGRVSYGMLNNSPTYWAEALGVKDYLYAVNVALQARNVPAHPESDDLAISTALRSVLL